jgi:hypothetical protein
MTSTMAGRFDDEVVERLALVEARYTAPTPRGGGSHGLTNRTPSYPSRRR